MAWAALSSNVSRNRVDAKDTEDLVSFEDDDDDNDDVEADDDEDDDEEDSIKFSTICGENNHLTCLVLYWVDVAQSFDKSAPYRCSANFKSALILVEQLEINLAAQDIGPHSVIVTIGRLVFAWRYNEIDCCRVHLGRS